MLENLINADKAKELTTERQKILSERAEADFAVKAGLAIIEAIEKGRHLTSIKDLNLYGNVAEVLEAKGYSILGDVVRW